MAAAKPAEVLIVGAGPTGLVLALWLTRLGVQVRIVDHGAAPATTSRAVAVQARTLEFYRQVGLAIASSRVVVKCQLRICGCRAAGLLARCSDRCAGASARTPMRSFFHRTSTSGC
jgi:glycine/D-amino acid oxidase-like deaminating enzyme